MAIYASRVLKGCLFLLTILIAVSNEEMTNLNLTLYILVAFLAMTLIDVYCQVIGDQFRTGLPLGIPDYWHIVGQCVPQMGAGVVGALIFALAAVKLVSQDTAFRILEIGCTVLMILFCYASQRIAGRSRNHAVLAALVVGFIGAGFAILRGNL